MRIIRLNYLLTFLTAFGGFLILKFIAATLGKVQYWHCLDDSNIKFNESGEIDTNNRWRKLGLATYLFTAFLDDREPCSPFLTVMGFGEISEPPLYGTLVLRNGARIHLGKFENRRMLNPKGDYTLRRLGPYAYLWLLPVEIISARQLKTIIVQQYHVKTGRKTETEIPVTFPVYSAKTFGVCIESPLFGPVKAQTIIQNIEINKVLGAEWFTFYIYTSDQESLQVLHKYAGEGLVGVVENWGKDMPGNSTHYYGQTLSINECAYRNMYRVKYLVYADLDEFIVPRKSLGWVDMMKNIENFKYGTYLFRHSFFFENYDNNFLDSLHVSASQTEFTCNASYRVKLPVFLTSVIRSRKVYPPKERSKYILRPLYRSIIGVHEIFEHVENEMKTYVVPPDYGLLHHYRMFRGGLHAVAASTVDDEKRQQRTLDERTLVYKDKIVAALRRRLCR